MTSPHHRELVRRYYDENQALFDLFWTDRKTLSMNYGFWGDRTRGLAAALHNQHREMAAKLEVGPLDVVLDAGCGVGGMAIFIAREFGARTVGVTLSATQARRASAHAMERAVLHLARFLVSDYTRTGFADGSFTKIVASESVCHAERKEDFTREAFRLLRQRGRLVVADGFLRRQALDPGEARVYAEWCGAWAVPHLATVDAFTSALTGAGFRSVSFTDKTAEVMPSSRRIRRIGRATLGIIRVLSRLKLAPPGQIAHALACIRQHAVLARGIAVYGIFTAVK